MLTSKLENSAGFTLIEVLVSILLLGVIMTGGMALYHNANEIMAYMVHKKVAMELADHALEEIKEKGYGSIAVTDPLNPTETALSSSVLANLSGKEIISVSAPDAKHKQVDVEIQWKEANSTYPKSVKLVTYIAQ